ncbi:MAG TPA: DUF5674 family protein [Candidatus Paceibacterota bacterium]
MSELHIIENPITRAELKKIAEKRFGDLVKGAVDIEKGIMVLGGDDMIEFDSMINLKPDLGNRTRGVDLPEIQEKIKNIIFKLIA